MASGFAWMDCSIARTAARPVKSAWWAVESTETAKVELTLASDSRLLAGVSGAVNHYAEMAGMDEPGRATLVAAIEDACNEAFRNLPDDSGVLELTLAAPAGRVEAVLTFRGIATGAARAEKIQRVLRDRLDRVTRESIGDVTRLALVKNVPAPAKS
jgi:hypothetical protein